LETNPELGVLVTDLTNPAVNRYAIGDIVELGDSICKCKRTLPTIKNIYGRIRNMIKHADGRKQWPTFGEKSFRSHISKKILRHQLVQVSYELIEARLLVDEKLNVEEEENLLKLMSHFLDCDDIKLKIVYVDGFPLGKFESFRCNI